MEIRKAIITGASSGIGLELSQQLAARGVEVALLARRVPLLEDLQRRIVEAGGKASVHEADVTDPDRLVGLLQRLDYEMGGIDLVVANAGIGSSRWAGKMDWESCRQTIDVNVVGATATLTALLPRMVERNRGHLVGISSLAGSRGLPKSAIYSASKAFLSVFLESLRIDLMHTDVAVTDVRPGFIRTPLTAENDFPMPFLMDVDDAVKRIVHAIERRETVAAFPWPVSTAVHMAKVLPSALYDRVLSRSRKGPVPGSSH